jgi:glycosyltransferase involved in cell wall biosynthesis
MRRFSRALSGTSDGIVLPVSLDDLLAADFRSEPTPSGRAPRLGGKLRVNWVIPPLAPSSGGQQNIMRFVEFLEAAGHRCTLFVYDPLRSQTEAEARASIRKHFPNTKASLHVGVRGMGDCDAVVATTWQTAYPVFSGAPHAAKLYFVQDFEPDFYGASTERVLAANTYSFGFHGVTAGRWLSAKLQAEYGMECDYYDFGSDFSRYPFVNSRSRSKILFYARPLTPRRGFELGVLTLALFARQHPDYEINLVGADISGYRLPFSFVNHGSLPLDQLNGLYNQAAAALVISLTNMSLLPLELLSAGCIPIVNTGDNNRLVTSNPNIVYAEPSPAALARALGDVVNHPRLPAHAKLAAASVQGLSWEDAGRKLESVLLRVT